MGGTERSPSPSVHYSVIDGAEIRDKASDVVEDLARRMMDAKSSRRFLEAYGSRLDWHVIGRRMAPGNAKVARGDFGEVVASGWMEDFCGLETPIRKMHSQISSGQTLPGIDTIAMRVSAGVIEGIHLLESKLRTTSALLTTVGADAYSQLKADRDERALDLLAFGLEQLHSQHHPLTDALCEYLESRTDSTEDSHEIVLLVEADAWDDEVLNKLDEVAGDLPNCRVHVLLCTKLVALVDNVYARAGLDLVDQMER